MLSTESRFSGRRSAGHLLSLRSLPSKEKLDPFKFILATPSHWFMQKTGKNKVTKCLLELVAQLARAGTHNLLVS